MKANPTYRSLGDHTETLEIEYDMSRISYRELLDIFWHSHNPSSRPYSRQYMPAVFYRNEMQKKLSGDSLKVHKQRTGTIYTKILPLIKFYPAEDYHQKYYLRHNRLFTQELHAIYPNEKIFAASTATARVNGFLAGKGNRELLVSEIDSYGLSDEAKMKLLAISGVDIKSYCK